MCPVFSLQCNFGFLGNHAGGGVEVISLYIYQFLPILSILGLIQKLWIIPFRCNFYHLNVASIHLAIHFRVFEQSCRRRVELISLCIYLFLPLPSALGLVWKIWIIAFKWTLDHVNAASIQLAMQFQVFGKSCRRRGRSNQFVYLPILAHFQCSWAHLNAMNYSFQMNTWSCKCGQYSACNSISGFWGGG